METVCKALLTSADKEACKAIVIGAGFSSTGIAAGSIAAKLMAYFAIANGGGVAAGGLVAFLQSAGAAGLSWFANGVVAGAGGTVGWLLSTICNQTETH
ncbi:interferon alpha-inducible protein 27-like protein 2A isoform X5 [Siniperca chuatsi]|uniref:interferon alpha-inducible protein 27-like protein 2A isoform X5 n=1 Tax=Siniperca chuatsi TaxID=119488 RepID=UPI001CE0F80F|nr:interferon alpha-inducible protein 27-like protein 2A isoform X5 [Siniperca chuatsi]